MTARFISASLFVALVVVGCKSSEMVKMQEKFAADTCACKDMPCLKKVQEEQTAWVTKNGQEGVGSEADVAKVNAANKKMEDCANAVVKSLSAK